MMNGLITLIPAVPLLGFLVLSLAGRRMTRTAIALTGSATVGISALLALVVLFLYWHSNAGTVAIQANLWNWFTTAGFSIPVRLNVDTLSLCFVLVITWVGFLIHVYSIEFMGDDPDYARFFACMNLFVGSMLILVLAGNLLLLYLGWEGVGLCSYLLIGFWHHDPANGYAARKAFIITRVGDTSLIIGIFLILFHLKTLDISTILHQVPNLVRAGDHTVTLAALLLLGGAVGKSAQLPLQTWLPDAMAGPSPVSALIHAATMVTAGVYLVARMHVLYELAPIARETVAVVGCLTLLLAGFSALTQHDLKRVLAYSTISQIGYMFLALGVGAWSAAVFHFVVHAFFKALLFLAGGAVIHALNGEHNIYRMGGLRRKLPLVYWTFLAGSASLAALPLITAGFYSKDQILWQAWASPHGSPVLWAAALAGAFLTSLYTFRLVFLVFFGEMHTEPTRIPGRRIRIPLVVLAVLSIVAGFIELPRFMGPMQLFSHFLSGIFPVHTEVSGYSLEIGFQLITALISLSGIWFAYRFCIRQPAIDRRLSESRVGHFLYRGWDFDRLYDALFVKPWVWLAEFNKEDVFDILGRLSGKAVTGGNRMLSVMQNGRIRWYLMAFVIGIVCMLTIFMNW